MKYNQGAWNYFRGLCKEVVNGYEMNFTSLVAKRLIEMIDEENEGKEFVVCDEEINGQYGHYSIRVNTDCNPLRFKVIANFDNYEDAAEYVDYLRHPEDYFNLDEQLMVFHESQQQGQVEKLANR